MKFAEYAGLLRRGYFMLLVIALLLFIAMVVDKHV
jgi:hypothetical protein